jgi:metal-responsive CopG/Arc/MetJ family transcriptional regulator
MPADKVAITIDSSILKRLDRLVAEKRFPSRSRAIQDAVAEKLVRLDRTRLAREAGKLNRSAERKLADESLAGEAGWPEY